MLVSTPPSLNGFGGYGGPSSPRLPSAPTGAPGAGPGRIDDEIAALKRTAREQANVQTKAAPTVQMVRAAKVLWEHGRDQERSGDPRAALTALVKMSQILANVFQTLQTHEFKETLRDWPNYGLDLQEAEGLVKALEAKIRSLAEETESEGSGVKTIQDRLKALQANGLQVSAKSTKRAPQPPTPILTPDSSGNSRRMSAPPSPLKRALPTPLDPSPALAPVPAPTPSPSNQDMFLPAVPTRPFATSSSSSSSGHTLVPTATLGDSPLSSPATSPQIPQQPLAGLSPMAEVDDYQDAEASYPSIGQFEREHPSPNPNPHIFASAFAARHFEPMERAASVPPAPSYTNVLPSRPTSPMRPSLHRKQSLVQNAGPLVKPKSSVSPDDLMAFKKSKSVHLLLIDVRKRAEFEKEHLENHPIICIEPIVLDRSGLTADQLENALELNPKSELTVFQNRHIFEYVVIYDQSSRTPSPTMKALMDAIFVHSAQSKTLKHPPMLLVGGIDACKERYGEELLSLRGGGGRSFAPTTQRQLPVEPHSEYKAPDYSMSGVGGMMAPMSPTPRNGIMSPSSSGGFASSSGNGNGFMSPSPSSNGFATPSPSSNGGFMSPSPSNGNGNGNGGFMPMSPSPSSNGGFTTSSPSSNGFTTSSPSSNGNGNGFIPPGHPPPPSSTTNASTTNASNASTTSGSGHGPMFAAAPMQPTQLWTPPPPTSAPAPTSGNTPAVNGTGPARAANAPPPPARSRADTTTNANANPPPHGHRAAFSVDQTSGHSRAPAEINYTGTGTGTGTGALARRPALSRPPTTGTGTGPSSFSYPTGNGGINYPTAGSGSGSGSGSRMSPASTGAGGGVGVGVGVGADVTIASPAPVSLTRRRSDYLESLNSSAPYSTQNASGYSNANASSPYSTQNSTTSPYSTQTPTHASSPYSNTASPYSTPAHAHASPYSTQTPTPVSYPTAVGNHSGMGMGIARPAPAAARHMSISGAAPAIPPKPTFFGQGAGQLQKSTTASPSWNQSQPNMNGHGKGRKGGVVVPYWSDVEIGLTGLRNMGNTCYMNSAVQCLSATVPFAGFFRTGQWRNEVNKYALRPGSSKGSKEFLDGKTAFLFHNTLRTLWGSELPYIVPTDIWSHMAQQYDGFNNKRQHDAGEWMGNLLALLSVELNRVTDPDDGSRPDAWFLALAQCRAVESNRRAWRKELGREDSVVFDCFGSLTRTMRRCERCGGKSPSYLSNTILPLTFLPKYGSSRLTPRQCFESIFQTEEDMKGGNQWLCPVCKSLQDAKATTRLAHAPPVLLLQLSRYEDSSNNGKKKNLAEFPLRDLDISEWMVTLEPEDEDGDEDDVGGGGAGGGGGSGYSGADDMRTQRAPYRYDLYAVVNHDGQTIDSGHYTAMIASGGRWKECNDSVIRNVKPEEVITPKAYILCYKRKKT